jgi:Sulfotransferase family
VSATATQPPPAPFIVGVSRSGTTLLRLMLDAHPELAIPPETRFIPDAVTSGAAADPTRLLARISRHPLFPDLQLDGDELLRRWQELRPFDAAAAFRAMFGLYAARQGKSRWGDKSPQDHDAQQMPLLAELFPEACFVHLIRDGRDVHLSQRRAWAVGYGSGHAGSVWARWVGEAREVGRALGPRYVEMRFEDLVEEPERELRRVCDAIRLDFDPAMLRSHEGAASRLEEIRRPVVWPIGGYAFGADERVSLLALTTEPPRTARVGRWRVEMPPLDRWAFDAHALGPLGELRYEVASRPALVAGRAASLLQGTRAWRLIDGPQRWLWRRTRRRPRS